MAIRSFFGYDDVVTPNVEQYPAGFTTLPPLPFSFKAGAQALKGATYVKEAGWLKCKASTGYAGTAVKTNYLQASLTDLGLTASPTAVVTIGLRWLAPVNQPAAQWVHPMAFLGSTTVNDTNLKDASVFPYGSIPGFQYGQEYYLEAQWDVAANIIRRRIDGKAIADIAMGSNVGASIAAGATLFVCGAFPVAISANTVDLTFWFKDMYVIEKTNDGTADSFLGPQRVFPITASSFDQPSWPVVGAADAVAALNTPIVDAASLTTQTVTSDGTVPVALVGLNVGTFHGQVNAVSMNATARKNFGAAGVLGAQMVTGSDSSTQVNAALANAVAPLGRMYFGEKSPSNQRWTRDSLLSAKFKLITS